MAPLPNIITMSTGIPPGVQIKVVLTPNDPEKMIDYYEAIPAPAQKKSYKIKIDRIQLHCPIG